MTIIDQINEINPEIEEKIQPVLGLNSDNEVIAYTRAFLESKGYYIDLISFPKNNEILYSVGINHKDAGLLWGTTPRYTRSIEALKDAILKAVDIFTNPQNFKK